MLNQITISMLIATQIMTTQSTNVCSMYQKSQTREEIVYVIEEKQRHYETKDPNGVLILSGTLTYPQIRVNQKDPFYTKVQTINQQIETKQTEKFQKRYKAAVENLTTGAQGVPLETIPSAWFPLMIQHTYEVTFNQNNMVSFLYTDFEWLGGAHPETNQSGVIYGIKEGKELLPEDLLLLDAKGIKQFIANEVLALYEKTPENYFKDEVDRLQTLDFHYEYYLNEEGFVFFFNRYAVAPYVAGIVSVPFKYTEHSDQFRVPVTNQP